jgi:hypothetical protein
MENKAMAQNQVFRGIARKIEVHADCKSFRYHHTAVVTVYADRIVLNSGGWRTRTTMRAMNQASQQENLGFIVYQSNFEWYVVYKSKKEEFIVEFQDNMVLER